MGRASIQSFTIQFLIALITIPLLHAYAFVLLAVVALTLPYRLLVYIVAKNFKSNVVGFIYGLSGLIATDPLHTAPTLNIIELIILDDVIPINKFREMFRNRIVHKIDPVNGELVYGRLQQYWVNFMGYNMWKWDPEFSIENHIIPLLKSYTRKDLPQLMSDLMTQPFKRDRSPWEITLIDNYKESSEDGVGIGEGKMVLAIKIHHTLADGFTLVKMFQRDLCNRLQPLNIPKPSGVEQSWWKKAARSHLFALELINNSIDSTDLKNTWISPLTSAENRAKPKCFTSILSGIPVSEVSAVRHKYHVSYLTVLLHCIQEGVRQAMEKEARSVPDKIPYLFTRVKPHHPDGCANHSYSTAVTLSMENASTESSLQNIETEMKKERLSMVPIVLDIFYTILALLPASLVHFMVKNMTPPGFTCSNVPVLKDVTSFDGANVTDVFATVGPWTLNQPLTITACGDGGKQSIVLRTDQSFCSSEEAFLKIGDYIKDEFDRLVKSLQDKQLTIHTIK